MGKFINLYSVTKYYRKYYSLFYKKSLLGRPFPEVFGCVCQNHNKHWKQSCPHIMHIPWPSRQGNWTDGNGRNTEIRHGLESSFEMLGDLALPTATLTNHLQHGKAYITITPSMAGGEKKNGRITVRKEPSYHRTEGCKNQTKFKTLI